MKRKKILFFLYNSVGGAERISVLIGKELDRTLFEVKFCIIKWKEFSSIIDFIPTDCEIIQIPYTSNPLKKIWRLFSVIKRECPNVVFSSLMSLNTKILSFSFLFPNTRFIVRCENYLYTFNNKQQKSIKHTYHLADEIIAQTIEMKEELVEKMHINENKITVLHNPIDKKLIDQKISEEKNPFPQNGKKHFVASGRFVHQKGFDLLIQAFVQIAKNRNDIDLYIIGDKDCQEGKVYHEIMNYAKEHKVQNLLHCVGYQKNPYIYVKYADCFVLSSRWEGLPNVLIEAQYLGTPAAAFKCIPIVERIIQEGKNGFLAESENVNSLAKAMLKSLDLSNVPYTYNSSSINDFQLLLDK